MQALTFEQQEKRLESLRAMTSEERMRILSNWETQGLDQDALTVEIEARTGIDQEIADLVTTYEGFFTEGKSVLDLEELAKEIAGIKAGDPATTDLPGIENIDVDTAFRVLDCEDDILTECGVNVEVE